MSADTCFNDEILRVGELTNTAATMIVCDSMFTSFMSETGRDKKCFLRRAANPMLVAIVDLSAHMLSHVCHVLPHVASLFP